MAKVFPPLDAMRPTHAGGYVERELLTKLVEGLPNTYEVFHGLDWTIAQQARDHHGELDVVVLNQAGDIAVLEIKAGEVRLDGDRMLKTYADGPKDVLQQSRWQFNSIQHRIKQERLNVRLQHFLALPHQRLADEGSVSFPRERMADAVDCEDLPGFIQRKLGPGMQSDDHDRVAAFLHNRLQQETDVTALSGTLKRHVAAISGGLATWVPRIHAPSGVIRVTATAGSGKTQLALRVLRDARAAGLKAAYVCFNRPLSDRLQDIAPPGVQVASFHQLCWQAAGKPQGVPDFAQLASQYIEQLIQAQPDLDVLIIDELQDMQAEWVAPLIGRVHDTGRIYLLDDPSQSLYPDREAMDIPEAVVVRSNENYRSPQKIVATINALRLTDEPVQACSPFEGTVPEIHHYKADGSNLIKQTAQAVQRCIDQGFDMSDITVLCWRGREKSALMGLEQLADWRLARFTGDYDASGQPIWSDGSLRIDTLRRFKGQACPAIVLTEIDFSELDTIRRNMLFVGMTRAGMHLEMVMTDAAERALSESLNMSGSSDEPVEV
ncbi:MAG: ATP-binding domain-containing protein [Aquabacterium sp.]